MDRAAELYTTRRCTEPELIERARGGDEGAFGELYHLHKSFVYNVCYRLLADSEDAADAAQAAFVHAYAHIRGFRGESEFRTWLYRIAINIATAHLRREQRRRVLSLRFEPPPKREASGDRVWEAMLNLPIDARVVLTLFYFEDLSCEEMAQALGCSPAAARTRLCRARAAFKESYARLDV